MQQDSGAVVECRDGCKRTMPDMDAASQAGWLYLQIQHRWRCPDCYRALTQANAPENFNEGAGI